MRLNFIEKIDGLLGGEFRNCFSDAVSDELEGQVGAILGVEQLVHSLEAQQNLLRLLLAQDHVDESGVAGRVEGLDQQRLRQDLEHTLDQG